MSEVVTRRPRALSGVWKVDGARCELRWDGVFASEHPELRGFTTWCLRRTGSGAGMKGDVVVLEGSHEPLELTVELVGPQRLQLGRFVLARDAVARTSIEMKFCCSVDPCLRCETLELGELERYGQELTWLYRWECPRCGQPRIRQFSIANAEVNDLLPPPGELGEGPSQLVTLGEFRLALAGALAASDYARAMVCIREAQKLGAPDLDAELERVRALRLAR